ncbi:hypothetical protein D9M71_352580 [compost metagenome]
MTVSFITSSVVTTFLNSASGLLAAWRLALARIAAKVSIFVPYFCMCSRPAPPKVRSGPGTSAASAVSCSTIGRKRARVTGRSSQLDFSEPGRICSKPRASTQSAWPLSTAARARYSAVEPVEQLLLTLMIGMPVRPTS